MTLFSPAEAARMGCHWATMGSLIPCLRRWLMTLESILRNISAGVTVTCGPGVMDLETRREAMALLASDHKKGPKYGAHLYFCPCRTVIFSIRQNTNECEFISLSCWLAPSFLDWRCICFSFRKCVNAGKWKSLSLNDFHVKYECSICHVVLV